MPLPQLTLLTLHSALHAHMYIKLIMQLMQLMDRLLKKVNLNLRLLTYHVLAVTQTDGIMEFVPDSFAFSAVG